MGYMNLIFPCGLEIESKSLGHHFNDADYQKICDLGCPIHGKKCKEKPKEKGK